MKLPKDLEHLLDLYTQLRSLAQANLGVAQQGNFEALDHSWQKRRSVFNRLCKAREALDPLFAAWDEHLAALPAEQAEQCRGLARAIKKEGRQTIDLDDQTAKLLESAKGEIRGKLGHIREGRRVLKAYRGSARAPKPNILISTRG